LTLSQQETRAGRNVQYNCATGKAGRQKKPADEGMLTYTDLIKGFHFGPWHVVPERDVIIDGEDARHIEPIVMNVFVVLASHSGGVVTKDQLIDAVWDGRPQADEVITRCISALRRSLGDDAKTPQYIETLQKRGYRVMQRVRLPDAMEPERGRTFAVRPVHLAGIVLLAGIAFAIYQYVGARPVLPETGLIESVAVYPFDCKFDPSKPAEHLCFGFAEEVISGLNRIPGVRVIKKRESYDGNPPKNVHGIVTGTAQIINNVVRISAFLEDVRSDQAICCDSFDATEENILDKQKEVAAALANAIDLEEKSSPAETAKTESRDAELAYWAGRVLFEKRDHDSNVAAINEFKKAIQSDPGFGRASLGLAYTYINWPDYDGSGNRENRESNYSEALKAIENGIAKDSGIRDAAGTVYGFVYHKRNQWNLAAGEFERAINADIEQAMAFHWYSYLLASVGRRDAAFEHALRALELDPDSPAIASRVAITALYNNDPVNAGRYFEAANSMGLENFGHLLMYSLYLYRDGQFEKAKEVGKRGLTRYGVQDAAWFDLVVDGSLELEKREQAVQTLAVISADADNGMPENVEMFFWMLLDEVERAMAIARRLETEVGLYEPELIFTREFAPMRQHRDFDEFVEAIGLKEYWSSAGCALTDGSVRCQ